MMTMKTYSRPSRHALCALAAAALLSAGCADMSERQKGTAIGAGAGVAAGAAIGSVTGGSAGTGAAIGGVLGVLTGGAKGAAIGAAIGGAAGAGSVIVQGRDELNLEPGSEFRIRAFGPR